MRALTLLSIVPLTAVLASGCTDPTSLQPRPRPGAQRNASLTSARPRSYPNSLKYRDQGFHPAVGSAGSATIAVQALLSRSGTTDLQVTTTGSFEDVSAAPTGKLASVQVKVFGNGGNLTFVRNETNLTSESTASFVYTGLARGMPLQVQAIVRGFDGARSNVVTVAGAVHARPDLVAARLGAPPIAPLGAPVNFTGFILERLGDLGARASCVLYVDGAAVDRADNIWVDAGRVVTCAMTHTFAETGTHTAELRVEGVNPGDYDDGNNRTTSTIRIAEPKNLAAFSVYASNEIDDTWYRALSVLMQGDTLQTWDQTYVVRGPFQYASIIGLIPRSLAYPIRIQGQMVTNDATINAVDITHAAGEFVEWQPGYCASSASFNGGAETFVCVYTGGYLNGYTTVQYDWWGADVRYHTESWVSSWDANGELLDRYLRVEDYSQTGPMFTFGPDFTAWFQVQGAGDVDPVVGIARVPLSPFTADLDLSNPCTPPLPTMPPCYSEDHFHIAGVNGYTDFGSWPSPF